MKKYWYKKRVKKCKDRKSLFIVLKNSIFCDIINNIAKCYA